MAGPAEHFQTKWGQAYVVGVICPLDWNRVIVEPNQSVKHELKMCARCLESTSFLSGLFT